MSQQVTMTCVPNDDGSQTCDLQQFNQGDAAWMLTSTAIVYMMTPGVGFFYGGMVGNKNVINTLLMSIICMGIVTVQWNLVGYSWAFGPAAGNHGAWGNFDWAVLRFPPAYTDPAGFYAPTYPLSIHSAFQCAFAVITPALISGSIIGRMKFIPYCLFILLWSLIAYNGLACWVWNVDGWLHTLGALDFAGGTVVHISSATAGLTACIILGKRHDWKRGHVHKAPNIPFVVLGASLLWVGWMGFNAGSAVAANALAGTALINTNGAAASAMMTWVVIDALRGKVSALGACSGIVVGLVAITPAAGFVHPGWALLIGIVSVCVVYPAQIMWKRWMRVDDTLDVFTCHGLGGISGSIMTGLFASAEWGGVDGAFYGRGIQLGYQLADICTTLAWSSAVTAVILGILHVIFGGLRPTVEEELLGLDQAAHGEEWEVATQAEALLAALEAKDKAVNGPEHHLGNGTISMNYTPRVGDGKPVHVELALHTPKEGGEQLVTLDRTSSASVLVSNGYEAYATPKAGEKHDQY